MPETRTPPPVLECQRLRLRPLRADDAGEVFALFSDPDVTRYWSFPAWTAPAEADAWLAERLSWGPPTVFPWALADLDDDRLLGTVSLFVLAGPSRRAELGFSLLPAHQGRGLARAGVRRAIGFGFDTLGLERIEADVDPLNQASSRLLEQLGFQREGVLRDRWRVGGGFSDSWIYGVSRSGLREAA